MVEATLAAQLEILRLAQALRLGVIEGKPLDRTVSLVSRGTTPSRFCRSRVSSR
jgi:hypothetical protein